MIILHSDQRREYFIYKQRYNYNITLGNMDFIEHLREREKHAGKIFKVSGPCTLDKT